MPPLSTTTDLVVIKPSTIAWPPPNWWFGLGVGVVWPPLGHHLSGGSAEVPVVMRSTGDRSLSAAVPDKTNKPVALIPSVTSRLPQQQYCPLCPTGSRLCFWRPGEDFPGVTTKRCATTADSEYIAQWPPSLASALCAYPWGFLAPSALFAVPP
ncbi:hypothetical protein OSB04_011616 [Centaurea solstitialis]|uniref:Uncharacterized protein n=1 Tax=Centaurea solstitialis TaxID=347529 RepID=A0AA38WD43_9ASTR|nr:hypothetical protein OSB04_011616 [Centaurea solstitialis]